MGIVYRYSLLQQEYICNKKYLKPLNSFIALTYQHHFFVIFECFF